jgi:hypothetical protein
MTHITPPGPQTLDFTLGEIVHLLLPTLRVRAIITSISAQSIELHVVDEHNHTIYHNGLPDIRLVALQNVNTQIMHITNPFLDGPRGHDTSHHNYETYRANGPDSIEHSKHHIKKASVHNPYTL